MEAGVAPSAVSCGRGWLLARLFWPPWDPQHGEDAFAPGEGGAWVWYPLAGSIARPANKRWRWCGSGAGVVGSLTRRDGRARFVPSAYWRRRGISDWEVPVDHSSSDGTWVVLSGPAGTAVLRQR